MGDVLVGVTVLVVGVIVVWMGVVIALKPRPSLWEKAAATEAPATPVIEDHTPQSVKDLEKKFGVSIQYESGRKAFIKYGHEFALYSITPIHDRETVGFVWADTLGEALAEFEQKYLQIKRSPTRQQTREAEREALHAERARMWDEAHKAQ